MEQKYPVENTMMGKNGSSTDNINIPYYSPYLCIHN